MIFRLLKIIISQLKGFCLWFRSSQLFIISVWSFLIKSIFNVHDSREVFEFLRAEVFLRILKESLINRLSEFNIDEVILRIVVNAHFSLASRFALIVDDGAVALS